jgi:type II secretory pathway pseudopilin PulG
LYAIGEIVLVVIGILIALQINNWNEQRKDARQEQAILERLHKEFLSNKEQLQQKIDLRNRINSNCIQLLTYFNEPGKASLDSIIVKHSRIITPTSFDPIQNDLVSSGNVEILKSEQLKQLLINWSTDVIQLQEVEQMFYRYHENNVLPYLDKLGLQRDIMHAFWKNNPINLLESKAYSNPIPGTSILNSTTKDELLNDTILEGQVAYTLTLNEFNNQESITLMKRIDEILRVLKSEIKT